MKIFISWSGDRSRAIGEVINDWLRCVIQAAQPWMSTRDIDRGALWLVEINEQLKDTSIGIICLTHENNNRPWILFEAGALAKGLSTSRVCPLLIDLEVADVDDPLGQFNLTFPNRTSMWSLVHTINGCLGQNGLDVRVLEQVFDTYWPQFEEKFQAALAKYPQGEKPKAKSEKEILNQILAGIRSLNSRVGRLETDDGDLFSDAQIGSLPPMRYKRTKKWTGDEVFNILTNIRAQPDNAILEYLLSLGISRDEAARYMRIFKQFYSASEQPPIAKGNGINET